MTGSIYEVLEKEKDGRKLKVVIRQVTPDLIEPVVDHMCANFLQREPMCKHSNLIDDPVSVESMRKLWRSHLADGAAIVALLDDANGIIIIGANATYISKKDKTLEEAEGEKFNQIISAVVKITDEAQLWDKYGVESYLSAVGLSVDKSYHGLNLGEDILRARKKVCEMFNLSLTATVFTSPVSQHLAAKVGFETVLEYPFKDFNYSTSNMFKDLEGNLSVMAKKYD